MNEILLGKVLGFSLEEVIWMCTSLKKSGILRLTSPEGTGHIGFSVGLLVDIVCPAAPKLGELMIRHNFLTSDVLLSVLEEQSNNKDRKYVGEILIEKGLANADTVRMLLEVQAYLSLKILTEWKNVLYEFAPVNIQESGKVSISFQGIEPFQILQMLEAKARQKKLI
jgi:hypothetical protein